MVAYLFVILRLAAFLGAGLPYTANANTEKCVRDLRASARLGDLTESEIEQIQRVVNRLQREIVVVGSAAQGRRRNLGRDVPFGKGEAGRSDIDYVLPTSHDHEYNTVVLFYKQHESVLLNLPELDPHHCVLFHVMNDRTARIWFRPQQTPVALGAGVPNLEVQSWSPYENETARMEAYLSEVLRPVLDFAL